MTQWPETISFDPAERDWRAETANIDGTPSYADLTFGDADTIKSNLRLKPHTSDVLVYEGQSGSIVFVGTKIVGMILGVDTKKRVLTGYSWRHLNLLIQEFFERSSDWAELPLPDGKPVETVELFNGSLVVGTRGGGVYEFSRE